MSNAQTMGMSYFALHLNNQRCNSGKCLIDSRQVNSCVGMIVQNSRSIYTNLCVRLYVPSHLDRLLHIQHRHDDSHRYKCLTLIIGL